MSNAVRWWETVRHLRPEQLLYRLYYPVKRRFSASPSAPPAAALRHATDLPVLPLAPFLEADRADPQAGWFDWLNQPYRFAQPAWGPSGYGVLWDYHLHQFTWLERVPPGDAPTRLLLEHRAAATDVGTGDDPYPSSLRLVATARWLLRGAERPAAILNLLYRDAHRIAAFPERHLLGNHLLQNAIALLHGGLLFGHADWLRAATSWLQREVKRQFLPDGAHVERSISYHAQLLAGLLKCLQLLAAFPQEAESRLTGTLREAIARGLGWLEALQFSDGSYPAFGDSHPHPYPERPDLLHAAAALGITAAAIVPGSSGYRRLDGPGWELFANVGNASPAYQPGHAHADALSFCLHAHGRPLIVDTGISTYDRNARRLAERGTAAHNTITVNGQNSADVWASFRMGRRAVVHLSEDTPDLVSASHEGYRAWRVVHKRKFQKRPDGLRIEDRLSGPARAAETYLHFHPEAQPRLEADGWIQTGCGARIQCIGMAELLLEPYDWCAGFNLRRPAWRLRAALRGDSAAFHVLF